MGRTDLQGEVDHIRLVSNNKTYKMGPVPVGSYRIRYRFASRPMRFIPSVVVSAKNTSVIHCDNTMLLCWKKN